MESSTGLARDLLSSLPPALLHLHVGSAIHPAVQAKNLRVILHHPHHIYHSSHQAPSNSTSKICLPSAIFLLLPRQMCPPPRSSAWSDSCLPKSLPLTPVRGIFYKGVNQIMSPPVGKGSPASHCPLITIYPQPEGQHELAPPASPATSPPTPPPPVTLLQPHLLPSLPGTC